jgi:hypothetical protein
MSRAASAALAAAVLLAAGGAWAQTRPRDVVPPERAARTEALIARAFPGATLDWDRSELVYPDGRRVPFSFRFNQEHRRDRESLVVASAAVGGRDDEALEQALTFRPQAVALPRCRLNLMRVDAGGAVLGYKETTFDPADTSSVCDQANFDFPYLSAGLPPPTGGPPAWPLVLINVTTIHTLPDARAAIRWAAVLDTDRLAWVSRLPYWVDAYRRDGRRAAFQIKNDRGVGGGGVWLFDGVDGGPGGPNWQLRAPCARSGCMVEPREVLDAVMQASWRQ